MGESPDRGQRDGSAGRTETAEDTAPVRTADPADGAEPAGVRPAAAEPDERPDAEAPDTDTPDTDTPDAGTPDAGTPEAGSPADDGEADTDATGDEDEQARPSAGDATDGSTVHLRVRTVDNATTALRMPADHATTALRLPVDADADADADADVDAGVDTDPDTDADVDVDADAGEEDAGEEDADAGSAADAPVSDATTMLRLPADARKRSGSVPAADAADAADAPAADATTLFRRPEGLRKASEQAADAAAAEPGPTAAAAADEAKSVEPADNATRALRLPVDNATTALRLPGEARTPAVDPRLAMRTSRESAGSGLKDTRKPTGGTAPRPVPESAPAPEPVPAPEPPPRPAPRPTPPAPLSGPDPAPVPPPPLPGPESTVEAMEVLAGLVRPVSPLKRAAKRITIWTLFLSFVLGVVVVAQLLRPLPDPKPELGLPASFTFSGEQLSVDWPAKGQSAAAVIGVGSVGTSGEQKPVSIASVTKVMNAYLILQAHPLKKGESGPSITVDRTAAAESTDTDQSRATLVEGQKLSLYQALELLMLPSANNVARLLARWDAGSEEAFVAKMNTEAAKLGMPDTVYADPAGYNDDTKSTAADQLKLAEQVMKNDVFRQIVAEPEMRYNGARISNTNDLVFTQRGSVIGVKTGSSTAAQSALMWAAVKKIGGTERTIIGVTLRQPAVAGVDLAKVAQAPSLRIIKSVQNGLAGQTLAKQGDVVGHVDDGLGGSVPIVAGKDFTVAGWSGITATLTLDADKLGHTVKAGTQVGTLSSGEGAGLVEVPVTLGTDLAPPSIMSRLTRLS